MQNSNSSAHQIYLQDSPFRVIRLSDKPYIDSFLSKYPGFSELIFSNIYNWRVNGLISRFKIINDNLLVRSCDVSTGNYATWLVGEHEISDTISFLLQTHKQIYLPYFIFDANAIELSTRFNVEDDSNNYEYIYDVGKNISLVGNKLETYRRNVKKFISNESNYKIVVMENLLDKKNLYLNLSQLFKSWALYKSNGSPDEYNTFFEFEALKQYLIHANTYDLALLLVYSGKDLIGFSTIELDHNKDMAYVCYAKSNLEYKGLSEYVFYKTAKYIDSKGIKHLNYEQDLGISNLRRFKSKLNPEYLAKSYIIKKVQTEA